MKRQLLAFIFTVLTIAATAQTAPDFTATDCNGISHNLYNEIASGKVIVCDWVMPCAACVGPSLTAYNIVQSYGNPNVIYYLIDDAANTSCTSLSSWATSSGIGSNRISFSTSSIVESQYGGIGMPHIAVIGNNGTMYFNGFNAGAGDATAIQNAINSALNATGIPQNNSNVFEWSVNRQESSGIAFVKLSLPQATNVDFRLFNEAGQLTLSMNAGKQAQGAHVYELDMADIKPGIYFLHLKTDERAQTVKFAVTY